MPIRGTQVWLPFSSVKSQHYAAGTRGIRGPQVPGCVRSRSDCASKRDPFALNPDTDSDPAMQLPSPTHSDPRDDGAERSGQRRGQRRGHGPGGQGGSPCGWWRSTAAARSAPALRSASAARTRHPRSSRSATLRPGRGPLPGTARRTRVKGGPGWGHETERLMR